MLFVTVAICYISMVAKYYYYKLPKLQKLSFENSISLREVKLRYERIKNPVCSCSLKRLPPTPNILIVKLELKVPLL